MRTEIRDEKEIKREKHITAARVGQRIAIILAVLSVIACAYFMRGSFADWYSKLKSTQKQEIKTESNVFSRIRFEPDDNNIFALYDSNLAVLNKSTFKVYSPEGEELVSLNVGLSNPDMEICRNFAVLYSREGKEILLANDDRLIETVETEGPILSLSANEDGCLAVIEEDELYRASVNVYNNKQKLVYQWKTSDYYVITAAVSPSSDKLMVVGYTQKDGEFISRLIIFDIKKGVYDATADIEGTVITNGYFIDKKTISLIGDNSAYIYSIDGELLNSYEYGNDTLRAGAAGHTNTAITLTDRTSGLGGKLVLLDSDENEIRTLSTVDDVRSVGISDEYIVLLYTQSVQLFDHDMNACSAEVNVAQVKNVLVNDNGLVMLIYNTDAGYVDLLSTLSGKNGGK